MKNRTIVLAAVIVFSISTAHASSEAPLYKQLLDFAASIFETKFWDTLDNYQARTVTTNLNKGASQLYQAKDSLIIDLQGKSVTKDDLQNRMGAITSQITNLRTAIRRFGAEISKETNLSSNDLIEKAGHELSQKQSGINEVKYLSPADEKERKMIINTLSEGMCRLKKVEAVSKCMLDSIDAKKLACDATEVKKDNCI